jgi:hypothetical protein
MTIEVRGKAPNFNGHMVRLALHLFQHKFGLVISLEIDSVR